MQLFPNVCHILHELSVIPNHFSPLPLLHSSSHSNTAKSLLVYKRAKIQSINTSANGISSDQNTNSPWTSVMWGK